MRREHSPLHILWLALVAVLLASAGCGSYDSYRSVCQITVGAGVEASQGSGTLIAVNNGRALILTCRHLAEAIDNTAKIEWLADGDQVSRGKVISVVVGTKFNNDLALIVCDVPRGIKPLEVAHFNKFAGPFHSVGFRGSRMYESIATSGSESDGLITLNEPFVKGMSGGPVIDVFGRVVGVVVGSDLETYGVAADGEFLAGLIRAHSN